MGLVLTLSLCPSHDLPFRELFKLDPFIMGIRLEVRISPLARPCPQAAGTEWVLWVPVTAAPGEDLDARGLGDLARGLVRAPPEVRGGATATSRRPASNTPVVEFSQEPTHVLDSQDAYQRRFDTFLEVLLHRGGVLKVYRNVFGWNARHRTNC